MLRKKNGSFIKMEKGESQKKMNSQSLKPQITVIN